MALHRAQHQRKRGSNSQRDDRQQPVVREHHGSDNHHQCAVENPCESTPGKELSEGLDIGGDSRNERPTTFVVVIGDAQPVDVSDHANPELIERPLAAEAKPLHRRPLRERRDHNGR